MKKTVSALLLSALLAFAAVPVALADTVYEAEDGKLGNGEVWVGESSNASGGKYVGGIDPSDKFARHVELTVNAPADGTYEVEISFANGGGDAVLAVIVNGEEQAEVKTPPTSAGWANFGSGIGKAKLTLKKGENSVKLANKDQYTQVDYLKVFGDAPAAAAAPAPAVPSAMPKTGLGGEGHANGAIASWTLAAVAAAGLAYALYSFRRKA